MTRESKNDGKRLWKERNNFDNKKKTSRDYDNDSNSKRHSKKFNDNNFDDLIQRDFDLEKSMFFDDQGDQDYQQIFV